MSIYRKLKLHENVAIVRDISVFLRNQIGQGAVYEHVRKYTNDNTELLLFPVYDAGHWILFAYHLSENVLYVGDSLPLKPLSKYEERVKLFQENILSQVINDFELYPVPNPHKDKNSSIDLCPVAQTHMRTMNIELFRTGIQTDSTSCGIYVIYAINFISSVNKIYPVFPVT